MEEQEYEPIHMPKNSSSAFFISALALVFGFAMIWYIWWLAGLSFVGIIFMCIKHSFNEDIDYYVPVEEIKQIEAERREQLKKAEALNKDKDDMEVSYAK